ncbi:MAG: hypothetical protein LBV58_03220, partial [Acholeplasmatales bacterium]|nr:hypothetical protein [Acholeplasmatales bacterium]
MKKTVIILILLFVSFVISNHVLIMAMDKDSLQKENYALFDKLYEKEAIQAQGIEYVDFMNVRDKEIFKVDNLVVEKDFLKWAIYNLSVDERKEILEKANKLEEADKKDLTNLVDFLKVGRTIISIENYINSHSWFKEKEFLIAYVLPDYSKKDNIISDNR